MKLWKKVITLGAIVATISTSSTTFAAASYSDPAEAVAGLTGRSVEDVIQERIDYGKSYGTIAKDAGVLEEFQLEILEQKKELLNQRVASGIISQAQADTTITTIKNNQAICNGTGLGYGCGAGYGRGAGRGAGYGRGAGRGAGYGRGAGMGNGFCYVR